MITLTTITLLINGMMIIVVMGALLIVTLFLHESSQRLSNYFALYMLGMLIWSAGSFLSRTTSLVAVDTDITTIGVWLIEIGFGIVAAIGAAMAAYVVQIRSPLFSFALTTAIVVLIINRILLINLGVGVSYDVDTQSRLNYSLPTLTRWVYAALALALVGISWRYFAKFEQTMMGIGFFALGAGQFVVMLSPRLRELAVAENAASFATVLILYGIVQSDVITPFFRRTRQVEIVQDVGIAITTLQEDKVLETIAARAASLLDANGSAIYLVEEDGTLLLSAVYQLPETHVGVYHILPNQGMVGQAFSKQKSIVTTQYWREMHERRHEGFPSEPVGASVAVPLILNDEVLGVLMVVENRDGHLFSEEYVSRLQLIAPQAAVTIRNNLLYEHERDLKSRLIAQQTQLQTVLGSTNNPVLAIDWRGRILFANDAALIVLGAQHLAPPIEAHTVAEFVKPEWLPTDLHQLRRDVRLNRAHVYEISIERTDYLCHVTRLRTEMRGWVMVLNDVTTLKEVDRLKTQTIRMTSHDLKNPLAAVNFYLELLEEDAGPHLDDISRQNLTTVWTQIRRMEQLINDILNLERVQSGKLSFDELEVREMLTTISEHVAPMAVQKEITLSVRTGDDVLLVMADQPMLRQAITNLLDNAIKFTPNGGSIQLETYADGDEVVIKVVDTGIGISPENQHLVFDRFYRVDQSRTKTDSSSGLGLSLVQAIVEQHYGYIELESEVGIGTTFTVRLPLVTLPTALAVDD